MDFTDAVIILRDTPIQLNLTTIQTLISGSGGILQLDTANYPDLNSLNQSYWVDHSPWGVPGDTLWVQEQFKVVQSCDILTGSTVEYGITIEYEDVATQTVTHTSSSALSLNGFISANNMQKWQSRLKLEIQGISMTAGYVEWEFTTVTI